MAYDLWRDHTAAIEESYERTIAELTRVNEMLVAEVKRLRGEA